MLLAKHYVADEEDKSFHLYKLNRNHFCFDTNKRIIFMINMIDGTITIGDLPTSECYAFVAKR